jgi:hypothetical protein
MEEAINYEEVPGTWAHALKANWLAFNEVVRKMDDSNGKVPHERWREYILWDMQRRHDEEMKNEKASNVVNT